MRTLLILGMGRNPAGDAPTDAPVPLNVQLEALKNVANYVRPRLQNVQVTGVDDGPLKMNIELMAKVGMDDDLLKLAEDFAIGLAQKEEESQ